jgi:hypothetical protein
MSMTMLVSRLSRSTCKQAKCCHKNQLFHKSSLRKCGWGLIV